MRSSAARFLVGLSMVASLASAQAYNLFGPYPWGEDEYYLKWGDIFAPGSPAGTITWSLMPNGTTLDGSAPDYIHGTSDLTSVFNQVGGQAAAVALIQSAFDHWSAVANVHFVYLGIDDGTPFSSPYASEQVIGDIRIGGFDIDGFSAGIGFAAPPNGDTTLEGDIILNNKEGITFYHAPEAEGELYDLYPPGGGFYRNDFEGLVAHELGHALGLAHSDVPSGLMCGYVDESFDGSQCGYYDSDGDGRAPVNRIPDADDIAGIQFLYGPALQADFNHDNTVDATDLTLWQTGYGVSTGASYLDGDADGDGAVTGRDFLIWQREFGHGEVVSLGAVAAVPEPTCAMGCSIVVALTAICRQLRYAAASSVADIAARL
jgi:hypothetical protein